MVKILNNHSASKEISFQCDGKCRICPYPGANCKSVGTVKTPSLYVAKSQTFRLDSDLLSEVKCKLHLP